METIVMMYVTAMPLFLAGVANLYFCKSPILAWTDLAIDGGYHFFAGQRILGPKKTWKAFWGMIVLTILAQLLWAGFLALIPALLKLSFVASYGNDIFFNLFFGFLLGVSFALGEIVTSFVKGRCARWANQEQLVRFKVLFVILNQLWPFVLALAALALFKPLSFGLYLAYVFLAGLTYLLLIFGTKKLNIKHFL